MYFYKVGYWTHDGEAAVSLYHERRYEPAAFEALVHAATASVLRREARRHAHFPFAWIYDQVARVLIAEHGFQPVTYTAEFEIFGSGSILDRDGDWPDLDRLTRYLQGEGLAPEG